MKKIIIFICFSLSTPLLALDLDPYLSAVRAENESFESIISQMRNRDKRTVVAGKLKFDDLDLSQVPDWKDEQTLQENFEFVRNKKFLVSEDQPEMQRRSTWLYPDNGCYARAALMVDNLEKEKIESPWKVFIFGNLKVETDNNPKGYVSWWYHVVPLIVVEGEAFVLDPAIDYHNALTLEDWALRQTEDLDSVTFAICNSNAYSPSSDCMSEVKLEMEEILYDQNSFLTPEWERQLLLERDPLQVLGENPPWLI